MTAIFLLFVLLMLLLPITAAPANYSLGRTHELLDAGRVNVGALRSVLASLLLKYASAL